MHDSLFYVLDTSTVLLNFVFANYQICKFKLVIILTSKIRCIRVRSCESMLLKLRYSLLHDNAKRESGLDRGRAR